MVRPIIIDCDPGQDDAVMLLLACASPELQILGVTTVAGNVPVSLTSRNALLILELAGRTDIAVYAGCERPLVREPLTTDAVHGATGIDGFPVREPVTQLADGHAVDFIVEMCRTSDQIITLVPTGPLTNIATALTRAPDITAKIDQIVLMGGAHGRGSRLSPVAEFNILSDPEAAQIVFSADVQKVAFGLDLTQQVINTPPRIDAIRAIGTPVADAVADMLTFYDAAVSATSGSTAGALHDPCPIAWLIDPGLFAGQRANVQVETQSDPSLGMTVVDFDGASGRPADTLWMREANAEAFYALLTERLARLY